MLGSVEATVRHCSDVGGSAVDPSQRSMSDRLAIARSMASIHAT